MLYIFIYRYDNGNFFFGIGNLTDCGLGDGFGFNVNIVFGGVFNFFMGDVEYLVVFR